VSRVALLLVASLAVAAPAEAGAKRARGNAEPVRLEAKWGRGEAQPARSKAQRGRGKAAPVRFAAKRKAPKAASAAQVRGWRPAAGVAAPAGTLPPPQAPAAADAPVAPAGEAAPVEPVAPPDRPPPPPPALPACDPSPWLGVIAEDSDGFRFRLTRTCVPAGTVLFQFRNRDLADHNLWAEGVAPAAPKRQVVGDTPGETSTEASAKLSAGTWRLYCSFEGHEAMSRLVEVTPRS
jgi:plastocyanin